ncbi:WYL domain-containing protein [Staphylococcus simulans]|uniref:WYL domain-containing protein n=1 Tax=Staphylococcus simulans TaxID=1286 RepID=UPI0021D09BE2|nr:WYL domain-containing protein [Staphylococcus simulans]
MIDRFPTAKLIKSDYTNNRFTVEIEVMGDDGILMWLFSQGSKVKVLEPKSLKEKYVKELQKMMAQISE